MLFLLDFKWNLQCILFSCVKTKANPNFVLTVARRSYLSFSVYLMNHTVKTSEFFNMWQWRVQVFVFMSNPYFSLTWLRQNYDFSLKVAKKLLSVIFKFNMISASHFPLRAVFYRFYDVICRHRIVIGTKVELKWIYFST